MEQWLDLIGAVDPRIHLCEIRRPEDCQHSVLNITFRESPTTVFLVVFQDQQGFLRAVID